MKDEYKAVGSWSTLGLEIVLSIIAGFFGGRWLDGRFGTAPWLSVLGFFLGCGAAGKAIHRTWKEMAAVTAREEREHGNPAPLYEPPEKRGEASPDERSGPISHEGDDEHAH
jgi:F0F1-type ATP synthase assembly protein I